MPMGEGGCISQCIKRPVTVRIGGLHGRRCGRNGVFKRYMNLRHALFASQLPLYKQMYSIVRALKDCSPNAMSKISHAVKSSIL